MKATVLNTPYNLSLLAELSKPTTLQPTISALIESLYTNLFGPVVDAELATEKVAVKTRLYPRTKEAVYRGPIIKKKQKVVVVDIMRGGIQPSQLLYLRLCQLLDPSFVRQDHIMSQRVNNKAGVKASSITCSKIGGSIEDAIVIIPDPMGATGHSIKNVADYYLENYGEPKKFVIINLVITPTYLSRLEEIEADVRVYSARKDSKMTRDSYIIPGVGGVGEMINNTEI